MNGLRDRIELLRQRDGALTVGFALSAVWLLMVLVFWLFGPAGDGTASGLARLVSAIGVVMPLALIWLAVGLARSIATLRAEADDLRARLAQMRAAGGDTIRPATAPATPPAPAATATPAAAAPVTPAPPPSAALARVRPADTRQTAMRFDAPESVPIDTTDLILALNFPDGPDDLRAIDALRAALRDHDTARLIRAAQDVVTLLAEADLYMDSLRPDPAPPELWRRFADGARGSAVAAIGGIHDETALEIASALLKNDEIFRDSAHHFLRHFDLALTRVISGMSDDDIAELAQTRSARAFMLLGRAAHIFG
ncbi:MAG: hypothetical protein Q4G22_01915 [Paracoccus sp. (in: a-proteobacteria)]|uniref:hypothetical protein n=1 Tax=Paracoccus sp. TaxID=267 RepID=UPI0026DF1971|nr:hypothetical protein [Paracoccus sp. (in: a-proteobacteria)]MDO5630572.1 hypothetical protein [Paracoccus sp. (in: a-proteobacteria)]